MDRFISPAVASVIRVCIDEYRNSDWSGRIYTRLNKNDIPFRNMGEMLSLMGSIWDVIGFPQESTIDRYFVNCKKNRMAKGIIQVIHPEDGSKDKMKEVLSEVEMSRKHGDQNTFIVRIQYRQNATWQGHVTLVEENKTVPFRSALELIKMIDGVQKEYEKSEPYNNEEVERKGGQP